MITRLSIAFVVSIQLSAGLAQEIPRACNANPECAALGLADDCCPTSLAGIFLDCCEDPGPSCVANSACAALEGDCCPTSNGVFLYCCFEDSPSDGGGYARDFSLFANSLVYPEAVTGKTVGNTLEYWVSTGRGSVDADVDNFQYIYERNADLVYDLLYLRGDIANASDYITGDRKFSITITDTTAPTCSQIILQLEHVEYDSEEPFQSYPTGRHSRYLATLPENGTGRIEFSFLDRPDEDVLDSEVNAAVLLFAPGSSTGDRYSFQNLDSWVQCNGGDDCLPSPTKACPALYVEIDGASNNRLLQDAQCTDCENPACVGTENCSIDMSYTSLQQDEGEGDEVDSGNGDVEDQGLSNEEDTDYSVSTNSSETGNEDQSNDLTTSSNGEASQTTPSGCNAMSFFGVAGLAIVSLIAIIEF